MGVACIALLVALGGTGYAVTFPRNSVGTLQIKNNSVTSADVKNRALLAADFAAGQLPRGPAGPAGPAGAAGAAGPAGPAGPSAARVWAVIRSDGAIARNQGVSTVSRSAQGTYAVTFTSDISTCAWFATANEVDSGTVSGTEISVNKGATNQSVIIMTTFDEDLTDRDFSFAALC